MKKLLIILITFLLLWISTQAQLENQICGTKEPTDAWEFKLQNYILANNFNPKKQLTTNYVIPVIFYVIHSGEPIGTFPNISEGQILSQMTILNQDFSGNAYNASNYPPNAFVNWAANQNIPITNLDQNGRIKIADFEIQFCLATIDTNGNLLPEPGINRINHHALGLPSPNNYATQATMRSYLDNMLKPKTI